MDMEFGEINLEKSGNLVGDLKLCEPNFSRAMRAFKKNLRLPFPPFVGTGPMLIANFKYL